MVKPLSLSFLLARVILLRFALLFFSGGLAAQSDYRPLAPGASWTYKITKDGDSIGIWQMSIQSTYTDSVRKYDHRDIVISILGDAVQKGDFYDAPLDKNSVLYKLKDSTSFRKIAQHTYKPGDSWVDSTRSPARFYNVEYLENPVLTDAGIFDSCYSVFYLEAGYEFSYIYAPNVGLVMHIITWENHEDRLILEDYHIPQPEDKLLETILLDEKTPYTVDSSGGIYPSNQLVVQFEPNTPDSVKNDYRTSLGVEGFEVCDCNADLELWFFGEADTTDINEKKARAEASKSVEKTGNNYFVSAELEPVQKEMVPPLTGPPAPPSPEGVIIAILDTGVDLSLLSEKELFYLSRTDASFCYDNSYIGWNLVDKNNNPFDNHHNRHGTKMVKRIIAYLAKEECSDNIKILVLKTHDENGKGSLFHVSCAIYAAITANARVINASWGWYGQPSDILRTAIAAADQAGITFVTAAGNAKRGYDLDTKAFYPAVYQTPNTVVVGALDTANKKAIYSNYSARFVDVFANGNYKLADSADSGTSYAAPIITASIAYYLCLGYPNQEAVRQAIRLCAQQKTSFLTYAKEGNILIDDFPCLVAPPEPCSNQLSIFPNPSTSEVTITANVSFSPPIELILTNQLGQRLYMKKEEELLEGNRLRIDLSSFPRGAYFLTVRSGDQEPFGCKIIKW